MTATTIGLIGVGQMGAGIGRALVADGRRVVTLLVGRSESTKRRALDAGLEEAPDVPALIEASDLVLSVVPPGVASAAAYEVTRAAEHVDTMCVFVDANAISPGRSRAIAATVTAAGLRYVDGGIIGGPPTPARPTAIYLSGPSGDAVVDALRTPEIRVTWLGDAPAAASAIKMAYAAFTKGTNALVLAIRAMARAEGVEDALVSEWRTTQPAALEWSDRAPATAAKAWRWVAEMDEIAASLEAAGQPPGTFLAAAELYARLDEYKDAADPPPLDEMIDRLLDF